ncbi:MAG: hypothetical protein VX130_05435 [Verrucomicrobiota bacterium]|nr:hypothetical protein [Verrucomicrobiota bacterium]
MNYILQTKSLTKRFAKVLAVDDLTFSLEKGLITGLLEEMEPVRLPHCQCCWGFFARLLE